MNLRKIWSHSWLSYHRFQTLQLRRRYGVAVLFCSLGRSFHYCRFLKSQCFGHFLGAIPRITQFRSWRSAATWVLWVLPIYLQWDWDLFYTVCTRLQANLLATTCCFGFQTDSWNWVVQASSACRWSHQLLHHLSLCWQVSPSLSNFLFGFLCCKITLPQRALRLLKSKTFLFSGFIFSSVWDL